MKFWQMVSYVEIDQLQEVAKINATSALALVSDERFILGAGVGWMKEEFDAYGVDFRTRGQHMNSIIEVLRKLWSGDWVFGHGSTLAE